MKSKIQEYVENAQGEFSCRSYSGRSMYGESCLGVDIEGAGVGALMALIVEELVASASSSDTGLDVDAEEIAEALRGMRTDSMGMGTIVYFPRVPYVAAAMQSDRALLLVESFDATLGTWSPEDECSIDAFAETRPLSEIETADLCGLKVGEPYVLPALAPRNCALRVTRVA